MLKISKKATTISVIVTCLTVVVYFGILIYKQLKSQTSEQKIMHCLELGSDQRASACIKLIQQGKVREQCHFEIVGIKEYSGQYGEGGAYYKIYEGTIKNTSGRKEHLKAMIGKLYTSNRVLVETGYTTIEEDIDSGVSLPFKINIQSSSNDKIDFNNLIKDIYPWFTSCK